MKKRFFLPLCLTLAIFFGGCFSYTAYKDYYGVDDYSRIWTRTGFSYVVGEPTPLFPSSLEGLEVTDFHCRYDQQLPLGEGTQLLLQVHYSDSEVFLEELDRISSLTYDCTDLFEGTGFSAYAIRLGVESTSEYALVEEENQTINYVYLQWLPLEEIELDEKYIPKGYSGNGEIVGQ